MAISVKFIADVVSWLKGLDQSKDALDENVDGLEDLMTQAVKLGTQAGKTTDEIARDFSDAFGVPLDRAKRAVQEVTGETEDLGDAAKDTGRKLDNELGEGGAKGIGKLGDAAGDVGGSMTELGSIARDVLSGDISGGAQGALDALGGLAAAAGVGGAVGASVITAISGVVGAAIEELTKFAKKSAEVKEGVIQDFIDLGDGLDQAAVDKRVKSILGDEDTRRQADLLSQLLGVDLPSAALAMAGDFENAGVTVDQVMQGIADAPSNVNLDDWASLQANMDGVTGGLKDGPKYADAYADAMSRVTVANADAAVAAGKATVEIDEFGDSIYSLPDGKKVYVDAETGRATEDLEEFNSFDLDTKKVKVQAVLDTSAWDKWTPAQKKAYVVSTRIEPSGQPRAGQKAAAG